MPKHPLPDFAAFLNDGTPIDSTEYHDYKQQPIDQLCEFLKHGGYFLIMAKQESQFRALSQILKAAQEAQPGVTISGGWGAKGKVNMALLSKPSGRFCLQYFGPMVSNVSEIWAKDRQIGRELAANRAAIELF